MTRSDHVPWHSVHAPVRARPLASGQATVPEDDRLRDGPDIHAKLFLDTLAHWPFVAWKRACFGANLTTTEDDRVRSLFVVLMPVVDASPAGRLRRTTGRWPT